MIRIGTRFLGTFECPEESIISFPLGIPPFLDQQAFVVISSEESPIIFLQSATTPELCFITVLAQIADPTYQARIERFDLETLQLDPALDCTDQLKCLTILTIPEQGPATANLAAPIVINPARNIAVQAVRSDRAYSHVHPLEQNLDEGAPC